MKPIKRGPFVISLLVLLMVLTAVEGYTIEQLPDIGIDYRTMMVNQSTKLTAAGMKEARNGDKILMRVDEKGVRYFKNFRTNEELAYPPVQSNEKKNQ